MTTTVATRRAEPAPYSDCRRSSLKSAIRPQA